MINKKFFCSFFALICVSAQATSSGNEILSMPCSITNSSTKTLKNGILGDRNWMGNAKTGDSINLVFRSASENGVEISIEPESLSIVRLSHILHAENIETDGVNWIRSNDGLLKWNNVRIYRQGFAMQGTKSRESVDLRYRSASNWDGILIGDILGDPTINSIHIMAINCKLPRSSWQKIFDHVVRISKEGTPSKK